ncbi:two-component regulator propeller domain-containing protein, partial [Thiolapillus sp.]
MIREGRGPAIVPTDREPDLEFLSRLSGKHCPPNLCASLKKAVQCTVIIENTPIQHDPDNPQSLSSNWVRGLLQDGEGTLWVATDAGLNELRPESG